METTTMKEHTALGGYAVKYWLNERGYWEVSDNKVGTLIVCDTEQEAKGMMTTLMWEYRNTEPYRRAFEKKFGTD